MNERLLESEFKTLAILPVPGVLARVHNNDISEWHCTALGEQFTNFRGGLFYFVVKFLDAQNQQLPVVTVYTPNAFIQANVSHTTLWDLDSWRSDPHARSVLNRIKNHLSGVGCPASDLPEENQKAIAIRSSVYTKLNPKWAEIFPELAVENGEVSAEDLSLLQQSNTSPLSYSSSSTSPPVQSNPLSSSSPLASSNVVITPPRQATADADRPTSPFINTPPSRQPLLMTTDTGKPPVASTSTLVSSSPNNARFMPIADSSSRSDSPLSSSLQLAPSSSSPPSTTLSQSSEAVKPKPRPLRPTKISAPLEHVPSDLDAALRHFSSDEGKCEIYLAVLGHLKETINDWKTSAEDSSADSSRANGVHSESPNVDQLTHRSNPCLTILNLYLRDLGADEGVSSPTKGVWCEMRANFGTWSKIRSSTSDLSGADGNIPEGEAQREYARQLIVQVLDNAMAAAWNQLKIRLTFSDIDLSGTDGSMRAVFQGIGPSGNAFARETEVKRLNLSSTRTSPRSLLSLHKLSNLEELLLDHCPSIQKSGKNVFSLLLKKDSIPSLTSLSVVGTSQIMSASWISEVEQRCPNLKKLYFTRQAGIKALGWSDNILMQTMREPLLLPCGHIGDRASLLSLGYCALDRQAFRVPELASLHPNITLLEKDNSGKWNALIVDVHRKPLEAKVIYHRQCGSFYNMQTLKDIYALSGAHDVNLELIDSISAFNCYYCQRPFGSNTRLCFPHSAEPSEKHDFANLQDVSIYGSIPPASR